MIYLWSLPGGTIVRSGYRTFLASSSARNAVAVFDAVAVAVAVAVALAVNFSTHPVQDQPQL